MLEGNPEYIDRVIIIELKYIKKNEYSGSLLNIKLSEGKEQLQKYGEDERLNNPIKYLVAFVGSDVKVLENIE